MKTTLDCMPCFVRQALDVARIVSDDVSVHASILSDLFKDLSELDYSNSPPMVAQRMYRRIRKMTGVDDPYVEIKHRFNQLALEILGELEHKLDEAADAFGMAVRLAIAGNVIDLGVRGEISDDEVRRSIAHTLSEPFEGDIPAFKQRIDGARRILYLTDNTGEIVFDRILLERMPLEKVTVAVRGFPAINDATMVDARETGLTDLVKVIDNGSDAPGTVLDTCSEEFKHIFSESDLIISKGQGNYETLNDVNAPVVFLFKVKCAIVASHIGFAEGTHVLLPMHGRE